MAMNTLSRTRNVRQWSGLLERATLLTPATRSYSYSRVLPISSFAPNQSQAFMAIPRMYRPGDTVTCHRRSMVMVSQHKASEKVEVPNTKSATPTVDISSTSNEPTLPINNEKFPVENGEMDNFLIITKSFWQQMERLVTKKGFAMDQVYLRVYVDAGGCSGFTYKFEFHSLTDTDDAIEDETEDLVWVGPGGAKAVVDIGSMEYLRGATLDYVQEMIKSAFEINNNPQSESACGCGSSFALKNFATNKAID